MGTLLRYLLLASVAVLLFMIVMQPRRLRVLGRKARLVGLLYVVAVVISAALRLVFGWGT